MKKAIGYIHLWLGLLSGLVVFVVAITGAAYVFYSEISDVTERDFRFVAVQTKPRLSASTIQALAERELTQLASKNKPARWDWVSIYYSTAPDRSVTYACRHYKDPDVLYEIFIDPYTGRILHARMGEGAFWKIVIDLHTTLMLGEFGQYLVEYGTLIFLMLIISGMVLWWPRNKAARQQRFSIKLKASPKRLNYDLHSVLGFYMCWAIIFTVLTGLVWSFDWARQTMYFLADGQQPRELSVKVNPQVVAPSGRAALDVITASIAIAYPNAYQIDVALAQNNKEAYAVRVWPEKGKNSYADNLFFHPVSGQLITRQTFAQKTVGEQLNDMTGDLHYGWLFGLPSKLVVFFACLIAASLPFTGFYIWWGRYGRSRRKRSRKGMGRHVVSRKGSGIMSTRRPVYRVPIQPDGPPTV